MQGHQVVGQLSCAFSHHGHPAVQLHGLAHKLTVNMTTDASTRLKEKCAQRAERRKGVVSLSSGEAEFYARHPTPARLY